MLDTELKNQLQSLFAELKSEIRFDVHSSTHSDQAELLTFLEEVASTSLHLSVLRSTVESPIPRFDLARDTQPTGIRFSGIPTGHEFTSLILAILNADDRGKLPEPRMRERIRDIRGPVRLRTYISLTCENCPDVVQALNQLALIHPDLHHEMIDGAYAQDDITRLGIQGVPSVVVIQDGQERMIHSGRIGFLDLVAKLETTFGKQETTRKAEPENLGQFDMAVIGGGPAGISAAIYSVRKGLKTALIVEKIGGQVRETQGIENLISVPYTEGPELSQRLVEHLSKYPVKIFENQRAASLAQDRANDGRRITLESEDFLSATSTIIATGAKWRQLGVPGEQEYIGRGVAFCPHCDGPYYKGKKVAVVGGGNSGVEAAIDLAGIVQEVVLIEYNPELKADQILVDRLKSLSNVSILTNAKTLEIEGNSQKVQGLRYEDRASTDARRLELDGVFVQIGLIPNTAFVKGTLELTPFGEIKVDEKCRTSLAGVYAAGDVTTTPYKQIIISMGEGAKAALAAFEDRMLGLH
jgi:alkyl hydroperoxide reductase subunit F